MGDRARVSGTEDEFIVVGIVSTEHEAGFRNLFAAFFGFAYLDIAQAEPLSINTDPNSVSLTLAEQYAPTTDEEAENIEREIRGLLRGGGRSITTVPELARENQQIADITSQLIVAMGLGAMLIGGVGIVNTMLVMVRRRTEEIAALKTFGLKGRQVASIFLFEAFLLGLVGSLLGVGDRRRSQPPCPMLMAKRLSNNRSSGDCNPRPCCLVLCWVSSCQWFLA